MDTCAIHQTVKLVTYCPSCRGILGGRTRSPKKTKAVRKNATKPRPRRKSLPAW